MDGLQPSVLVIVHGFSNGKEQKVVQLEYLKWGDFGTVQAESMLHLLNEYQKVMTECQQENRPMVYVHCSAGVGRSGVFVVLDAVMSVIQQIPMHSLDKMRFSVPNTNGMTRQAIGDEAEIDLVQHVLLTMRMQRPGLVQTPEQLRLIYEALKFMLGP